MIAKRTVENIASMRTFVWSAVGLLSLLAACKFDLPPEHEVDASIDAAPIDATTCDPATTVCEDGRYVACGGDGSPTLEVTCPLGCAPDEARCLDIDPSNGLAAHLDLARSGDAPIVTFTGESTIDTNSGVVFNAATQIRVPHEFQTGMRVFRFERLTIDGVVRVTGDVPIALVVATDVSITGLLDLSADGEAPGPGGIIEGDCIGQPQNGGNILPLRGGSGAGRYEVGAAGGATGNDSATIAGGAAMRNDTLTPLRGGCRGGRGQHDNINGTVNSLSPPGAGGGAAQIVAGGRIQVLGAGKIDASGGGGRAGAPPGSGGGSGGAILLEAPTVVLDGNQVVLSTKGGGGSAAGGAGSGSDGGTGPDAAAGGTALSQARGGNGGTETLSPTAGQAGPDSGKSGAGGGGSVGQIRINTRGGSVNPQNGAAVRSRWSTGELGTRRVP